MDCFRRSTREEKWVDLFDGSELAFISHFHSIKINHWTQPMAQQHNSLFLQSTFINSTNPFNKNQTFLVCCWWGLIDGWWRERVGCGAPGRQRPPSLFLCFILPQSQSLNCSAQRAAQINQINEMNLIGFAALRGLSGLISFDSPILQISASNSLTPYCYNISLSFTINKTNQLPSN